MHGTLAGSMPEYNAWHSGRVNVGIYRKEGNVGKAKGSITIYLLLSLILLLAVLCMLTESARVNCIQAKLRGITYMAADSCFSEYAREIFDEYGIMALWKTEAEFTEEFNQYIQCNLSVSDLELYRDADLYPMRHNATAISQVKRITDDNGMVFAAQVSEYMKYYLVEEMLEELLSNLQIFQAGSKIASFVNKINEYQDIFLKVGNAVTRIQTSVDKAKSIVYHPKSILGNMKRCVLGYQDSKEEAYVAQFNIAYWDLETGKDQLEGLMDTIDEESALYYQYAGQAGDAIRVLQQELEQDREDYTEETLEVIEEQLNALALRTGNAEEDYYRIEANQLAAAGIKNQLTNLDPALYDLWPAQAYGEIDRYEEIVTYYQYVTGDVDTGNLGLNVDAQPVKREDSGFLRTIKTIFTKGLLAAVAGEGVSDRAADTSEFPSVTAVSGSAQGTGLLSSSYNKLVMGEYILKHFGNYLERRDDTALAYEAEYVIEGLDSDEANLTRVAEDLVLLRSGLNLISFMKDPDKLSEAQTLAVAIIGFTGMEALVEMVKMTVISIWCLAEALCDVKALLDGEKVAPIKEAYEWAVSAVGLKNFSKTVLPAASSDRGMSYTDYLRVLLLMEDLPTLSYRTMDMIQADACANYNEEFRMKECIHSIDLQVDFSARQMFSVFPFVQNLVGNGKGGYGFSLPQAYSY